MSSSLSGLAQSTTNKPSSSSSSNNINIRTTTRRLAGKRDNQVDTTLFVYNSRDSSSSTNQGTIVFTKHDKAHLSPPRFLNDTIISFFMQHHLDHHVEPEYKRNIYLFNSFFFAKIKSIKAKHLSNPEDSQVSFNCASRWIKGDKIFSKEFLVMPVCERDHWILVIICYPSNNPTHTSYDIRDEDLYEPAVIVLNSSTGHTPPIKKILAQFLTNQWKLEQSTTRNFPINNGRVTGIRLIFPQLPQQKNNYNCGVYMLNYFYCFMRNPRKSYIRMYRGRDMTNWFQSNNLNIPGERRRMQTIVDLQSKTWRASQEKKVANNQVVLNTSSTSSASSRDEILQDFHLGLKSLHASDIDITSVDLMDTSEDKNDDSIIVIN